jgi:hypothetical protein
MSVLHADVIREPQASREYFQSEAAILDDVSSMIADGSESEAQGVDEQMDAQKTEVEESSAHDAAIVQLLAGIDEAFLLRPPKLPLNESDLRVLSTDAAWHLFSSEWVSAKLGWIVQSDVARLVTLSLPSNLRVVNDAVLAAMWEWFDDLLFSATSTANGSENIDAPTNSERTGAAFQIASPSQSPGSDATSDEYWCVDYLFAAFYMTALLGNARFNRRHKICQEKEPERARLSNSFRPSS